MIESPKSPANSSRMEIQRRLVIIAILGAVLLPLSAGIADEQKPISRSFDQLLESFSASIYGRLNVYDYSQYDRPLNSSRFKITAISRQSLCGSEWKVIKTVHPVQGRKGSMECSVTFLCSAGNLKQGSVAVDIDFAHWSTNNYVLLPAAAYNGNRYDSRRLRYSPKLHDIKDIGPDVPIIINDVPRLDNERGVSRIQERSGSMSVPSAGFLFRGEKKGLWFLFSQGNALGDYGVTIAESRERDSALLSLQTPIVRELHAYTHCSTEAGSWDRPHDFTAGESVTITFRLYPVDSPNTQSLFDSFLQIRKDMNKDTQLRETLPFSYCLKVLEGKFNAENYVDRYGYYAVGMRENFLQDWQIGWTGGMISTYPLLCSGEPNTISRVLRNFDWLFPCGISPSGFYWDSGRNGTEWIGGDIRNAHTKNWHLVRKSGDAVWYIIKQFRLMEGLGIPVKKGWKDGNRMVCDAFVRLWKTNGQLGQFVDSQTGAVIVGGSASGAIVPAALALASDYYGNPEYLKVAKQLACKYYTEFTERGISCGGPADALQGFDSESSYALLESYVTLYEVTGEKEWLGMAREQAAQFATWVTGYNYQFPEGTPYAVAGMKVMGSVFANIQNKHAAPGICTSSGSALLRLYRATSDRSYLDLLRDIAHQMPQYLGDPAKPLGKLPAGWVSERINTTDWDGPDGIGKVLPISTWAETSLMLTAVELPGLYVRSEEGLFCAFDNVRVEKTRETRQILSLRVTNPTTKDADIVVWEENKETLSKPLGALELKKARHVLLKAGESVNLEFRKG